MSNGETILGDDPPPLPAGLSITSIREGRSVNSSARMAVLDFINRSIDGIGHETTPMEVLDAFKDRCGTSPYMKPQEVRAVLQNETLREGFTAAVRLYDRLSSVALAAAAGENRGILRPLIDATAPPTVEEFRKDWRLVKKAVEPMLDSLSSRANDTSLRSDDSRREWRRMLAEISTAYEETVGLAYRNKGLSK